MPSTPMQRQHVLNTGRNVLKRVRNFFSNGFKTPDKVYGSYSPDSNNFTDEERQPYELFLGKKEKRNANAFFAKEIADNSHHHFLDNSSFYFTGSNIERRNIAHQDGISDRSAANSQIYSALTVYYSYLHGLKKIYIGKFADSDNFSAYTFSSNHTVVLLPSDVIITDYSGKNLLNICGSLQTQGFFDDPVVIDPWFNVCTFLSLYHLRVTDKCNKWKNKKKEIKIDYNDYLSPKEFYKKIALHCRLFFFRQALPGFNYKEYYRLLDLIDEIDKPFINDDTF